MQSSNTAVAEVLVTAMFSYRSLFSHACHATHTRHGLTQHPAEANEMQTLTCVANQAQRCVSEPTCGLDSIKVPSACSPAAAAADLVRSTQQSQAFCGRILSNGKGRIRGISMLWYCCWLQCYLHWQLIAIATVVELDKSPAEEAHD